VQGLIVAMYQTLADPIAIMQEEEEGRKAYILLSPSGQTKKPALLYR